MGSGSDWASARAAERSSSSRRVPRPRKIRQPAPAGDDLAAGAALGGVGPGAGLLPEVEERGEHAASCTPSNPGCRSGRRRVPPACRTAVDVGQESRRHDPAMGQTRVVVGLGVVEVDLGHARLGDVRAEERLGVLDGEPDVVQPALVRPAGRVPDHHGEEVGREVVVIGPGHRAGDRVPAVAAAERRARPAPCGRRSPPSRAGRPRAAASRPSGPTRPRA